MELHIKGELVMEAMVRMEVAHLKKMRNKWFYAYALASKTDWQIHVRIKSKMDDLKETIKFPQKDIIFEIQNQTQNNETNDTTDGQQSCEPADYQWGLGEIDPTGESDVLQRLLPKARFRPLHETFRLTEAERQGDSLLHEVGGAATE